MIGIRLQRGLIDQLLDGQPLLAFPGELEPGVYGLIDERNRLAGEVEVGPGRQVTKAQAKRLGHEAGISEEVLKGLKRRTIFVHSVKAISWADDEELGVVQERGDGTLLYLSYTPRHAALFVDLDGTLRVSMGERPYPMNGDEVSVLPRVPETLKTWRDKGYVLLGVTNQSGIALGHMTEEQFWDGYRVMQEKLGAGALDDVRVAAGDVNSLERKPHPTLGWELAEKYKISLTDSFFCGDRDTDYWFAEGLGLEFLPARNFIGFDPPSLEHPLVPFTQSFAKFQQDEDLAALSDPDLVGAHFYVHAAYNRLERGEAFGGWSLESAEAYHDRVAGELERRRMGHTSPLKGLPLPAFYLQQHREGHEREDEVQHAEAVKGLLSLGLEHPGEDVDKSLDLSWVEKGQFLPIGASGNVHSEKAVAIEDVLSSLSGQQAFLRRPFISLTGGVVNRGATKGDIDLLINSDDGELGDRLDYLMKWRLLRALPPDLAERVHFIHENEDHGPVGPHVPLFALALVPLPSEPVQMSLEKGMGSFFRMAKPFRPSRENEAQTVESFLSFFQGKSGPWEVTKKYDGVHGQIHVGGKAFTEEGRDITARLPKIMSALKAVAPNSVLDVEIEMWAGRTHLPRVQVAGYLSSNSTDDSQIVVSVFDIMHDGGRDLTKLSLSERREILASKPWPQSTMGVPSTSSPLNHAPGEIVQSFDELETVTKRITRMPGSEGVVVKTLSSPFPMGNETKDWVKYHKAAWLTAVVIEALPTRGGAYTYRYGLVRGGRNMAASPVKAGPYTVYELGRTFASSIKLSPGDLFSLEFETFNYVETDKGVEASLWAPRLVSDIPVKKVPDSVGSAMKIAESAGVLSGGSVDDRVDLDLSQVSALKALPQIAGGSHFQMSDEIFSLASALDAVSLAQSFKAAGAQCDLPVDKSDGISSSSFPPGAALQPSQGWEEEPQARVKSDAADPYMDNPPEDGAYHYVIQRHFRGKSCHMDLRMQFGQEHLIGWTVADLVAGAIKEPVTTLREAEDIPQTAFKVDFETGVFVDREPQSGQSDGPRAELTAKRKTDVPKDWLTYEGVVPSREKDPESPGATKNFPGVYLIVDQGQVHFGAQKADVHEYFLDGKLKGRLLFRQLATSALKRIVPAQEDTDFRSELAWLCIQPEDQTPYVLSPRAVKQGWMPPKGLSALPPWVKARVPEGLRYWEETDPERAKALRDELAGQPIHCEKAQHPIRWSVQRQIYRGPIVVRRGPSLTQWHLSIKNGGKTHFLGEGPNPMQATEGSLILTADYPWDKMFFEGVAPPGSDLNDTKETESLVRLWDHGKGEWLENGPAHKSFRLDGKTLHGVFTLTRTDAGSWRIRREPNA